MESVDSEVVESTPTEASTESVPERLAPLKKPRTEAQLKALEAARAKALTARKENAQLRQKEKAVKSHQKAERVRQVEEAYQKLPKDEAPEEEDPWSDEAFAKMEQPPPPYAQPKPNKRKPARRIVVTEVSSGEESDDHSDVEVVLPKQRTPPPPPEPTPEEVYFQRAMNRMFHIGL